MEIRFSLFGAAILSIHLCAIPEIFLHSDFERGETHTWKAVEPGARTIVLIPNERLDEWPPGGGGGVIEGNFPSAMEPFRYQRREGNRLKGVTGIAKPHPAKTGIRTGNLEEWANGLVVTSPGRKRMHLITNDPLQGNYSLRFDKSRVRSCLRFPLPKAGQAYISSFGIRFSDPAFRDEGASFPICIFILDGTVVPLLRFVKDPNSQTARLELGHGSMETASLTHTNEPAAIAPGETYNIEYAAMQDDSETVSAKLTINGVWQSTRSSQRIAAENTEAFENSFSLGIVSPNTGAGHMALDRIVLSNATVPLPPAKPAVSGHQLRLRSSAFRAFDAHARHAASHWQIGLGNSWLVPLFNSGRDTMNLLERKIPIALLPVAGQTRLPAPAKPGKPGKTYLARCRQQSDLGVWSDWSVPTPFEMPPPKETAQANAGLPEFKRPFISEIGKSTPLFSIVRGKWYDLHFGFSDPKGNSNLLFADLCLAADPENNEAGHQYRMGHFHPKRNYGISFSVENNRRYVNTATGPRHLRDIFDRAAIYFDDEGDRYHWDAQKESGRIRFRTLDSAELGPWVISGFARNLQGKSSAMFHALFHVQDGRHAFNKPRTWRRNAIISLGPLAIGMLLLLIGIKLKVRKRMAVHAPAGETLKKEAVDQSKEHSDRIRRAMEFMDQNYSKDISAKEVAQAVSLSPGYLGKLFVKEAGIAISNYLNNLRIGEAKRLLSETELNVTEIAYKVGYNSLYHFSYVFRELEGTSPRDFRKSSTG